MDRELLEFYFTYGSNHQTIEGQSLYMFYTVVEAETMNDARDLMFEARGPKWAFCYDKKQFGDQAERYGLKPKTLEKVAL